MAEGAVERTMLYDFYGELLTEKQREYFDLHYNEDLSLAEIADISGISRQGVWDIIKRAEATLRDIEAKTGLIARFEARREALARIEERLGTLLGSQDAAARDTARQVMEELRGRHTVQMISHRLSNGVHADNILYLERGRLAAQGTHDRLMACPGGYAALFQTQYRLEHLNEKEDTPCAEAE